MIAQKSRFHPTFGDSLWGMGPAMVEPSRASRDSWLWWSCPRTMGLAENADQGPVSLSLLAEGGQRLTWGLSLPDSGSSSSWWGPKVLATLSCKGEAIRGSTQRLVTIAHFTSQDNHGLPLCLPIWRSAA